MPKSSLLPIEVPHGTGLNFKMIITLNVHSMSGRAVDSPFSIEPGGVLDGESENRKFNVRTRCMQAEI